MQARLARRGAHTPAWAGKVGRILRSVLPPAQIRFGSFWGITDCLAQGAILSPLIMWAWHTPQLGLMGSVAAFGLMELLAGITALEIAHGLKHPAVQEPHPH
ncbi:MULTISPECIES: hypothetical protein [unclassified Variovorax]|uniref:hypothetical protein n=1 Tax=unclassified Variovorax TaxID=663243 RepID=UPI00076BF069|nr:MULTISPECIES: hypothetical protein [unclassified Variovorax]KWT95611.1 hypothetical protein APY03_2488 [Variovorax sp. WDL1]